MALWSRFEWPQSLTKRLVAFRHESSKPSRKDASHPVCFR
jgi:hypothetical protein